MLKKIQPYLITFSFVVLAVFSLFVSEIFQAPTKSAKDIIKNIQLFRKEELSKLQTLVLTNKNGIFQFDKNQTSELSPWIMTNPKQVTANPLFFEKLLSSLAGSKIKKTYPITEAHLENFSLKTSPTKLEYVNDINQRTKVTFGLHNSIDNSIFILLENSPEIYQIDYLDVNLENIGVNDLIQTTLSALDKNTISAIQIYNGIKKNETLIVNIMKNPPEITGWRLSEKEQGSEEKIFSYLDRISSLKPTQILESDIFLTKSFYKLRTRKTF